MIKKSILIVDDETSYLNSLERGLRRSEIWDEIFLKCVSSVDSAITELNLIKFDIVLVDLKMPKKGGSVLIDILLKYEHPPYIIVITGSGSVTNAISFIKKGVYDYISKPIILEELILKLNQLFTIISNEFKISLLEKRVSILTITKDFVASSNSMLSVHKMIKTAQNSNFPVLILGESGTGKEIIADQIHYGSSRQNRSYIKTNSAGIVSTLLESEMFGYEKGAFTGAITSKKGRFELANQGTLFLDEIGDMDISLQVKLLRVLQDGSFERVGGTEKLFSDARIITATNRNLSKLISNGEFREDLYYRLNIIPIEIPPLRERIDDVPILIDTFLRNFNNEYEKEVTINKDAVKKLQSFDFPGNIRELENIIARSFAMCESTTITVDDIPLSSLNSNTAKSHKEIDSFNLQENIDYLEIQLIKKCLKKNRFNKSIVAEELGVSRRQLYYKMDKHNIS
ncbi:MAG: sigma-54 dependent transcriptional regulator [Spirochaetaceae bacterium]